MSSRSSRPPSGTKKKSMNYLTSRKKKTSRPTKTNRNKKGKERYRWFSTEDQKTCGDFKTHFDNAFKTLETLQSGKTMEQNEKHPCTYRQDIQQYLKDIETNMRAIRVNLFMLTLYGLDTRENACTIPNTGG